LSICTCTHPHGNKSSCFDRVLVIEEARGVVGGVVAERGEDLQGRVGVVASAAGFTVKMHFFGRVIAGVFDIVGVAGGVLLLLRHGVDHF